MKPIVCLLLVLAAFISPSRSQEPLSAFLFDDYQNATIHFSDGRKAAEKINYNLVEEMLYFIDKQDGQFRIASDIKTIDSIGIGQRIFLLDSRTVKEKVAVSPIVYVQYGANSRFKPQTVGYGETSELAAVTTAAVMLSEGRRANLKGKELQVSEHYYDYLVEKNGKQKKFSNFNQLYRIYHEHRVALQAYVTDHQLDFNDVSGIVALCRYAEAL